MFNSNNFAIIPRFFDDGLGDAVIVCGVGEARRTFKVHKFWLAQASPVFRETFNQDLREYTIAIAGINEEAVTVFLKILYLVIDFTDLTDYVVRAAFYLCKRYELDIKWKAHFTKFTKLLY